MTGQEVHIRELVNGWVVAYDVFYQVPSAPYTVDLRKGGTPERAFTYTFPSDRATTWAAVEAFIREKVGARV